MKKLISLEEYLKMGGLLANVNWTKSSLIRSLVNDPNYEQEVISCEDRGELSGTFNKLMQFTFKNDNTAKYPISWVYIYVELVLDSCYSNKLPV